MKAPGIFFLLLTLYSCAEHEQNNSVEKEQSATETKKKEALTIFSPNTTYYTSTLNEDNPAWREKGYSVFQAKVLDSTRNEKFELLDVYGNENNIVVFNQIFYEGDSIKHVILDTLCNYYDEFSEQQNCAHSVGVFHKDELAGIDTKGIDGKSIISVVRELSSYKSDVDSAIALHKKQKRSPFEVIEAKRNLAVLKAWFANTKTKKIEVLKK